MDRLLVPSRKAISRGGSVRSVPSGATAAFGPPRPGALRMLGDHETSRSLATLQPPRPNRLGAISTRGSQVLSTLPCQVQPPPGFAHQLALTGDHLSPRECENRHTSHSQTMERIVPCPGVQPCLVDRQAAPRIEEHKVGIASHSDAALAWVEAEDPRRVC